MLVRKLKQNRVKQSSIQFRQTAKILALSSGIVSECEFVTGKYILQENDLLEKLQQWKDLSIDH